jgi:2-(1,2-epoxy-1,2-dihydrophenyl)acetyl-CoA isomerase
LNPNRRASGAVVKGRNETRHVTDDHDFVNSSRPSRIAVAAKLLVRPSNPRMIAHMRRYMDDVIRTELHVGWRMIALNRPDRLNAFTEPMHLALAGAIEAAEADPDCRALMLTGSGRAFCAGQDLDEARTSARPLSYRLEHHYNPLIRRLRGSRLPIVCAVNGVAAGAGASLALASDIVLAGRSARFIQSFAAIGLVPDAGATFFLPRLVGDARARALALLAEPLPAEHAVAWGLIWRCCDDDRLIPEAEALTARLAEGPTAAFGLIKRAFAASPHATLEAQLDLERDLQAEAGRTPDYAEGVQAFREKRLARFSGAAS